jgi:meiotic recombination protein SPO11
MKAMRMLERQPAQETFRDGDETEETSSRTELQRMLMLNVKAELQVLDAISGGVEDLLAPLRAITMEELSRV